MKFLAIWFCFLLLTGCAASTQEPAQKALEFRTDLMEAGGCSFTAEIAADYGAHVYKFALACSYADGKAQLEVLSPENIAGIRAETSGDGTALIFEDDELEFGQLANGVVSPVAAPWLLVQCWVQEYIAYAGTDGEMERVTYLRGYHEDELAVDTWFDGGVPTYAEMAYDGIRCLTMEILEFQMIP